MMQVAQTGCGINWGSGVVVGAMPQGMCAMLPHGCFQLVGPVPVAAVVDGTCMTPILPAPALPPVATSPYGGEVTLEKADVPGSLPEHQLSGKHYSLEVHRSTQMR